MKSDCKLWQRPQIPSSLNSRYLAHCQESLVKSRIAASHNSLISTGFRFPGAATEIERRTKKIGESRPVSPHERQSLTFLMRSVEAAPSRSLTRTSVG